MEGLREGQGESSSGLTTTTMADMDKSLDEIIEGKSFGNGERRGGHYRRDGPHRGGGVHKRRGGGRGGSGPGGRGPRTVMITNLYYDLNEDDLEGLFSQIGPIDRIKIQYDRSGRSEGYAWVTYRNPEDAFEAIRKFDGKKAAGQTISLTIAPGFFHEKRHNSLGDRLGRNDRRRGGGRQPRERGGNGRGRRTQKSAEELDAELEAYMTGETPTAEENATNENATNEEPKKQSTEDSSHTQQNDNNEMAIDD